MHKSVEKLMKSDPKTMAKLSVACITLAVLLVFGIKGVLVTALVSLGLVLAFLAGGRFLDFFFEDLDRPSS